MERKLELLAPGGDIEAIKAAIFAGANAIYCGLDKFNARNRAANISFDDLQGILRLAHQHDCEIFITLNIVIVESEIPALINLLNKLANTNIDGLIVQDLGMLYLLKKYYKCFDIHASTQMTTHNRGHIQFLSQFGVSRVNLSRELNIHEIKELSTVGNQNQMLTEVFVHGSNCLSFSGLCYMSSVHGGNSGNRGRCSQPCRDQYVQTTVGKDYPLNLKDNSAFFDIKKLYEAGVYSLKIEGRIKKADYVYAVVDAWKKNIQSLYDKQKGETDNSALYKVFNRDFSNTFLKGDINKGMFIDNPRDNTINYLSEKKIDASAQELEEASRALFQEKDDLKSFIKKSIEKLDASKAYLRISLSGECDQPLKLSVETAEGSFELLSEVPLLKKGSEVLSKEMLLKRFKAINETAYYIDELNMDNLGADLFISYKELTSLKKRLLFILNGSKESIEPITLPRLKILEAHTAQTKLSVLISSKDDLLLCDEDVETIYFQLPNNFQSKLTEYLSLFRENKKLIPWFPAVIIGDAYKTAVEFLGELNPRRIVSNNTGIAYEACERGIDWIAGPQLNLTNSYSLLCLKEELNCKGAFLSNELNKNQLKWIKCPEDFELHYSIYHPIVLMTSRQCLFHQVIGCEKNQVDDTCISNCKRTTTITNIKGNEFFIEKSEGNYHHIYNDNNYLNTAVVKDIPNSFTSFLIDLRDIKTETVLKVDKKELIQNFEAYLDGSIDSEQKLHESLVSTTCEQYKKGI